MPPTDPDVRLETVRAGTGRPVVVLHGGGGPRTVAGIVDHLSDRYAVLAPTIPGWDGTARPEGVDRIDDVARAVLALLREEGMTGVAVVGSSIGGWIAGAMAVLDGERRVGRLCLIDAVGVDVPGEPITDFFALDARGVAEHSFADPDRFFVDSAGLTPDQRAAQQRNLAAMRVYAGDPYMHDPALLGGLGGVRVPVLGIWGDHDGIVSPGYGRRYLAAFPDGRFEVVADAGHLPHLERPAAVFALLDPFLAG